MIRISNVVLILWFCFSATLSIASPLGSAPVSMEGNSGESVINLTIEDDNSYAVQLDYPYVQGDSLGRKKIWVAAGGDVQKASGHWEAAGAPFDIETIVLDAQSGVEIHHSFVAHPKLTSWGADALRAEVARLLLKEGYYKVLVRRIGSTGDLVGVKVSVSVVEAYHGK